MRRICKLAGFPMIALVALGGVACGGDDAVQVKLRPLKPQDSIELTVGIEWQVKVELTGIPSKDEFVDIEYQAQSEYVRFEPATIRFFQSDEAIEKATKMTALKETPGTAAIKIAFKLRDSTSQRELSVRINPN
jgi:hypothetical protein